MEAIGVEWRWMGMNWGEWSWVQVSGGECRWVELSGGEWGWSEVNGGECRWMEVSAGECRWVQVNGGEWNWVEVNGVECSWIEVNGSDWRWMGMNWGEWRWVEVNVDEWRWTEVSGDELRWMEVNGGGWRWVEVSDHILTFGRVTPEGVKNRYPLNTDARLGRPTAGLHLLENRNTFFPAADRIQDRLSHSLVAVLTWLSWHLQYMYCAVLCSTYSFFYFNCSVQSSVCCARYCALLLSALNSTSYVSPRFVYFWSVKRL